MNWVVFYWSLALFSRFVVNISLLFKDWLTKSDYVFAIYPVYYTVAEYWPIIDLLYKLAFSHNNFSLDDKPPPVLTSPGVDLDKVNVFFGKRGSTLCALKFTTVKEIKMLQGLSHPNIINYIDHDQVKTNGVYKLRLYLEFVPPIPAEASSLINYVKAGYTPEYKGKYSKIVGITELVTVTIKIAEGLTYLHNKNICHLDIKVDLTYLVLLRM